MAIDSENKRRSTMGYTGHVTYPAASGSVATADRPHVTWLYSGLTYPAPPSFTGVIEATLPDRYFADATLRERYGIKTRGSAG